jgi:hypothetical protein
MAMGEEEKINKQRNVSTQPSYPVGDMSPYAFYAVLSNLTKAGSYSEHRYIVAHIREMSMRQSPTSSFNNTGTLQSLLPFFTSLSRLRPIPHPSIFTPCLVLLPSGGDHLYRHGILEPHYGLAHHLRLAGGCSPGSHFPHPRSIERPRPC